MRSASTRNYPVGMSGSDRLAAAPRPPLAYRITPRQWLAVDVAAAAAAMLVITFGLRVVHGPRFVLPTAGVAAITVAATLPVAVRRLWPLPVLAVVTVAVAALTAVGRAPLTSDLMLGMAVYMAAVRLPRTAAVVSLVATEAAIVAGLLTAAATARTQDVMLHSMLAAAAMWFVGYGVRERRRYRAGLAEQAAQRQRAEAEHARHALQEERLRIARELHDVLAHTLSVVTVQAGVGRRVGAARPAEATRALRAVEEASRGALDELRRLLCLLRSDDEPGDAVAGLAPAPGLGDLGSLAAMVRDAGTPVLVDLTGDVTALPPVASLTAYRIVQEALTNVVRHAPGAEATVRVGIGLAGVRIEVTDSGRAWHGPDPAGRGPGRRRQRARDRRHARAGRDLRRHGRRRDASARRLPGRCVPACRAGRGGEGGVSIGVVVADDQAIVRAGFRLLIDSEPDMTVLGEAADGAEAVAAARRTTPDVVLMDIRMPVMDGVAATRLIAAGETRLRVLILTTFDLDEYVFAALHAGASGFMLKDRPPEELLSAIRVIAAGEALLAPNVTRRLIEHFIRQPEPLRTPPGGLQELTVREREVLALIAAGLSNTEIAGKLVISVPTAKTHVSRILAKLAARDRAQLVVIAYQSGLVKA